MLHWRKIGFSLNPSETGRDSEREYLYFAEIKYGKYVFHAISIQFHPANHQYPGNYSY